MAYEINKSDGTSITINDGQINNADSNVQLIGRNRADYGAPIAQNFVRLLENFAAESAPNDNPNVSGVALAGQLWYKPSTNTLSVFDGTDWQSVLTAGGGGSGTLSITGIEADTIDANTIGSSGDPIGEIYVTDLYAETASFAGGEVTIDQNGNVIISSPATLSVDTITGPGNEVTINDQLNVNSIDINSGAFLIDSFGIGVTGNRVPTGLFNTVNANLGQFGSLESQTPGAAISIPNGVDTGTGEITTSGLVAQGGSATIEGDWTTSNFQLLGGGSFGGSWTIDGTWTVDGAIVLGSGTVEANYADIAERFKSDKFYAPGTVVAIGGNEEVTETTSSYSDEVFGVVADQPAFILNNVTNNVELMPAITLVGRTPVRVKGKVKKGDRLTSSDVAGVAMAADKAELTMFNYIGRALENKTTEDESLIWVAFGAK